MQETGKHQETSSKDVDVGIETDKIDLPDVDFNLAPGDIERAFEAIEREGGVRASILLNGDLVTHNCGWYLVDVPVDPVTGLCALPYDKADEKGFLKIDLLPNRIYDLYQTETGMFLDIDRIYANDIPWEALSKPEYYQGKDRIPHLYSHKDVVDFYNPRSVDDLAIILALIRPAKKHLIGKPLEEIRDIIWEKTPNAYCLKKSAAVALAFEILLWTMRHQT